MQDAGCWVQSRRSDALSLPLASSFPHPRPTPVIMNRYTIFENSAMPTIRTTVACPIHDSFRVQQVAGMFDVPLVERATEHFEVDVPGDDESWQIGLIVGPSGSGKSTIARRWSQELRDKSQEPELNGSSLALDSQLSTLDSPRWPADRAVVDCFDNVPIRHVVELFIAVGFGSPPSWVKPYHVLSNGERFRCDLARALSQGYRLSAVGCQPNDRSGREPIAESRQPVVFDEFTSVVDRNVAKVCSAAIAKGIRRGHIPCRFVAVTCHYDVAAWLEPDWIVDMATCMLHWRPTANVEGSVARCPWSVATDKGPRTTDHWFRRPPIELEIHRCELAAWQLFKRHHYLNGSLAASSRCYLTTWNGVPVNFCATLPVFMKRRHRRFTRIVTLPDYQGLGIGMRAVAAVAELHRAEGHRINVTSSHPALIRHCRNSPAWRTVNVKKAGGSRPSARFPAYRSSTGRAVVSFEYVGRKAPGVGCQV